MKFAGTVVLYNPQDEKELLENLNSYLPFLEKLYVVDNSTKVIDFVENVKAIDKVEYISYTYNTFMGYGGIRYMTFKYSDAEWEDAVADAGGELDYK